MVTTAGRAAQKLGVFPISVPHALSILGEIANNISVCMWRVCECIFLIPGGIPFQIENGL